MFLSRQIAQADAILIAKGDSVFMEKRFWIIVGVIAVLFIGFLYFGGSNKDTGGDAGNVQPTNHVKGKIDSKVTLEEYGDYQCPVCGAYYPTVSQVVEKYQDKIKFQFRNLPLSQAHQHAFAAARAAEAASEQGKFWEMYDALFTNQQTWSSGSPTTYFEQYATQIGLSTDKYKSDFASDKVNKLVNADLNAFKKKGDPMATPTFYLNGKKLDLKELSDDQGPTVEKFSAKIDAALKASQ
jgi:protein-disulfide isomerase